MLSINIDLIREIQRLVTGAEIHDVNGIISMIYSAAKDGDLKRLKDLESGLEQIARKIRARRAMLQMQ